MKKLILRVLSLLMLISLLPSMNTPSAKAESFSLKFENQPVCLNSLKSIWAEFGSPFPCFINGSEVVLSKPVQSNSRHPRDLYFRINKKAKDITSDQIRISSNDYRIGLNEAMFYTKDSTSGNEEIFGSPINFIIYNSFSRLSQLDEPKKNYTIMFKNQANSFPKNLSDFDLQPVVMYSSDIQGNKSTFESKKIFTTDLTAKQLEILNKTKLVESISTTTLVYPDSNQQNPPSWGLDRIDQDTLPLDRKFTYGTLTGAGVNVYVIDSGLKMSHTEFTGRIPKYFSIYGDEESDAEDCNGHGTHVAGTILGTTYGVAKKAKVIPVRVFPCSGGIASYWIQVAMEMVIDDHEEGVPAVVNMSLGGGANDVTDSLVQSMVDDGLVVVVAAGNDSGDSCSKSPARAANAITVGSSTDEDKDSSFSNVGSCVDVFAPGSSITSAWWTSSSASATISGTSMASPHVAGAAALILERDFSSYENNLDANYEVLNSIVENASENVLTPCCGGTTWWGSTVNLLLKTKFLLTPINSALPNITGTTSIDQTLTTSNGTWTGWASPNFSYQWFACSSNLGTDSCLAIGSATKSTFKLTSSQVGKNIRVRITASYSANSSTAYSLATSEVAAPPTVVTPAFTITGTAAVGQSLTYTDSSMWNAYPAVTPTYQGYRCTRAISATKVLNTTPLANCTAIEGEVSSPYTLQSDDSGKFITFAVTGTNAGGTLVLWAKSTTAVGSIPANSPAPTMASSTGSFGVGATITATSTAAQWTGSPVPKLTFQWEKYNGSSWVAITNATRNTFKLTSSETGSKIRIAVTGTNTYGATTAYSAESGVVG
jgi:subtilisin family serine protease